MPKRYEQLARSVADVEQAAVGATVRLDVDLYNVNYLNVTENQGNRTDYVSVLGQKASPLYNVRGNIHAGITTPAVGGMFVLPHLHSELVPYTTQEINVVDGVVTMESSSALLSHTDERPEETWHITRYTPLGQEYCERMSYDSNTDEAFIHVGRQGSDEPFTSASDITPITLELAPPEIADTRARLLARTLASVTRLLDQSTSGQQGIDVRVQVERHRAARGHIL